VFVTRVREAERSGDGRNLRDTEGCHPIPQDALPHIGSAISSHTRIAERVGERNQLRSPGGVQNLAICLMFAVTIDASQSSM